MKVYVDVCGLERVLSGPRTGTLIVDLGQGEGEGETESESQTVSGLLRKLAAAPGGAYLGLLSPDGSGLKEGLCAIVNGQNMNLCGGLDTHLRDGDRVCILPVLGGG